MKVFVIFAIAVAVTACASVGAAPAKPPHDIWIEGEDCEDHDFNTIGRDPAFKVCYGGAILQLQTMDAPPAGGYHATYRPTLSEDGWWEVWLATTKPRSSQLCPYSAEVTGYHSRRLSDVPVESEYGRGSIFGWVKAGTYRLPEGTAEITLRCDERRPGVGDYLLYIDALALRRVSAPESPYAWIAGEADDRNWVLETEFEAGGEARQPLVSVLCDGSAVVFLNGEKLGEASGTDKATRFHVPGLRAGENQLRLEVDPGDPGAVMAWVDVAGEGGARRALTFTGDEQWRVRRADGSTAQPRQLGGMQMRPYGDMTVQPPPRFPVTGVGIPIKTGNLSVGLITAAAKGRKLPEGGDDRPFGEWKKYGGVSSVEDYICWLPLERERGNWDWSYYEQNCQQLHERGMGYSVYPWLHFVPEWVLDSEYWDPLLCLKHGESTWAFSIWSPKTIAAFDRFYEALREQFGKRICGIYVSMVCDYGEIGYPVGMTQRLVPTDHIHPGYWCDDEHARADFREFALARYGSVEAVNDAWGTEFGSAGEIDYPQWAYDGGYEFPKGAAARRQRLDFADWYLGSMVDFASEAVATSRQYFPQTPHEIKIGFGQEPLEFGSDLTAYVKRSKTDGYTVRSTHGKLPMFFYRRFSTAAKQYGVPLVTEPPSGVSREEEVERMFKDATSGTTEYFDYPANLLAATDLLSRFGQYMEGDHSLTDVAFFYPTTDHLLRPGQANPKQLLAACDAARECFDWDIVDERLVRDGALKRYNVLLWPEGQVLRKSVFSRIRSWVEGGGVLIVAHCGAIESVEGGVLAGPEMLVAGEQLPAGNELLSVDAPMRDSWFVDVGGEHDDSVLWGDWHSKESGHYEWGGAPNEVMRRWSGARPGVRLPIDPTADYRLAAAVARHPKQLDTPCGIIANGVKIGDVPSERTAIVELTIPADVWEGKHVGEIVFTPQPWRPSDIGESSDQRTLGIGVNWIKLWKVGTIEPEAPNTEHVEESIQLDRIAASCRRSVGDGWTIHLPFDGGDAEFVKAVSAILHKPGGVIPGYEGVPVADGARDGVWTALLPERILLLNRSDAEVMKEVAVVPDNLGRFGVSAAAAKTVSVSLAPHTMASIELPEGKVLRP